MEVSLRRIEERALDLWREGGFLSYVERGMECLFDGVFGVRHGWEEKRAIKFFALRDRR